jgi:hypothetical protein
MYLDGIGIHSYSAEPPTENGMVVDGYWSHNHYYDDDDDEKEKVVKINFEVDTNALSVEDEEKLLDAADKIFSLYWYSEERIAEFEGYITESKLYDLYDLFDSYGVEVKHLD